MLAAVIVALDQATKRWVSLVHFQWPNGSEALIPGFFSFTYVQNTGGAFGIFDTTQSSALALASVSLIAAAAIVIYTIRDRSSFAVILVVALGLTLGGAVGNFIDRVRLHYVVDFLDVYVGTHHWPVFNIADSAICVGVALLAVHYSLASRRTPTAVPTKR